MTTVRKLLILDIDETLVFATEEPLTRDADFRVGHYFVYKRPYLNEFLTQCFTWFDVAIWTSATPAYAAAMVDALIGDPRRLAFLWASDRCSQGFDPELLEHYPRKSLSKVKRRGYRLEQVIIIDDTPRKWLQSYGNLVQVRPYNGQETDEELKLLTLFLHRLRKVDNVRALEKRGWQASVMEQGSSRENPSY